MKNKNIKTKSTSVFKRLIAKKLILGGAQFGNKYGVFSKYSKMKDRKEIKKIFDFSSKKKLKYIDTAHDYRNSEDIIGKLSKKNFLIISKINIPNNFTYERIQSYVYQKIRISLKRLNRKHLEILLLHNFDDYLKNKIYLKKIFKVFVSLKKKGLVKKIGISTYFPEKIHEYIGCFNFKIAQVPFNVFDQRLLQSKIYKSKKFKKIQIHARSVFLQGILLKENYPKYFNKWQNKFKRFNNFIRQKKINALTFCLKLVLNNKRIDKTIIGFQDLKQLKEIFEGIKIKKNYKKEFYKNFKSNDYNLIIPRKWKV